jgi:hypothetical protein
LHVRIVYFGQNYIGHTSRFIIVHGSYGLSYEPTRWQLQIQTALNKKKRFPLRLHVLYILVDTNVINAKQSKPGDNLQIPNADQVSEFVGLLQQTESYIY